LYTGLQLSRDLDVRVRQTNAASYMSAARKNYFLRMSVVKNLEQNYASISRQKSVDEISPLIKTYTPFAPYNEQVLLKPLHISNIVNTTGNTYQVFFDRPHNFNFGLGNVDITFSGVLGGTYTTLNNQVFGASDALTSVDTSVLITTAAPLSGTYTANSGQVVGDYWVSNYYHLLAVSLECLRNINATIVKVNISGGCLITLGTNNIRNGEYLKFSGFGGLTGLSGYKYVKKVGERQIRLYNDVGLTTPVTVTGTYTNGGIIERTHNEYCEPLLSDQKISAYQATENFPLYESNENRLACYSSDVNTNPYITNTNYFVDYITTQAEIDITNDTTDLLQFYNQEMCRMIIEQAALLFFATNTSGEDVQLTEVIK